LKDHSVYYLAFNDSAVFAGTWHGDVLRSTDNGDNWSQINNGVIFTRVYSLAINDSGHIFVGAKGGRLFRSTDNGDSWSQINNGWTSTAFTLAFNDKGHVFAGTGSGVFRSTDNGDNWTEINNGLTTTIILSLALNDAGQIFAGTSGGGVFRSVETTTVSVESSMDIAPKNFALSQNYPNPFNPSTIILYSISKSDFVTLIIYDILGREIQTLVNEFQIANTYSVNFDASNLSNGVYFYRLQIGQDFVEAKKMLLIK